MSELFRGDVNLINPSNTKKGRGLTRTITEMPEGQTILAGNTIEAFDQLQATYTVRSDYSVGRNDSMHGVTFADLTVEKGGQTNRRLTTQPVAIKPYPEAWMAARDFRLANRLNAEKKVTFEPLGFTKIDGKVATLTRFEQGVTSFDNILWNEEVAPDDEQIAWSLSCAAATLILLHGDGYAHGDFQVKNTAYDLNSQPRIIDTTTMRQQNDPYKFGGDLTLYLESLSRFGAQTPYPSEDAIEGLFLEPYHDSIEDMFPKSKQQIMREIIACLAMNLSDVINDR